MKYNHENIRILEDWLDKHNRDVEFSDDFVRELYHSAIEPLYKLGKSRSIKQRRRGFTLQYDFVRRDLVKIAHKRANKSSKEIDAGFVYLISNPAWPGAFKVGSAIDVNDRLNSYQTSAPYRDFVVEDYYFVWDRRKEESSIHLEFPSRSNEWVFTTREIVLDFFKKKKLERSISPKTDKLYEIRDIENTNKNYKLCDWYKILRIEDDMQ